MSAKSRAIYTIGHSNQPVEQLLALLRRHAIEVLTDVRSAPYSRYASQFNQRELQAALREAGVQYVFLGKELGGRPEDESLYDDEGHVDYRRVSRTTPFRDGIERVKRGAERYRVALMCSEEDPTDCHRRLLVGRVLRDDGVELLHIRGDGRLDRDDDLPETALDQPHQPSLFGGETQQEIPWRSTRSVLPRSPRDSSSTS
jgi:uncharacterized protein (DUF488 family)